MPVHLAVALDGTGWHPAAWREPDARPQELFTAGYWRDLITEAERGRLDFVTIEDALTPQSSQYSGLDDRTDQVRGRLDAVLIASRVAPLTRNIGLVPTATVLHTEPFHISKAIATLDYVSTGRAGVRIQIGGQAHETSHFGRRQVPEFDRPDMRDPEYRAFAKQRFAEAGDYVEVVRRLWDSWEDDAEIRDAATGRFVDRDKLHYIDFSGEFFSVKGPSITPRPPQGQPPVTALAHARIPYTFAARSTDVVYVTPHDLGQATEILGKVREEQQSAGRAGEPLHVFGDLVVFLDNGSGQAATRKARLDNVSGAEYTSDARIFTGTAAELADELLALHEAGLTGFRLRPGVLPHDLDQITRELVPELRRRNAFRAEYEANTLRGLLGLSRPANRYAVSA
ncbi:MAG TPA: LLM class flavin-dependent oxidoreductase [Pseudonocardiaceae bacterium]|nr:LLM class flavin-dependent oxidoreductase [Pseudonocardiaceae bacterium]